MASIKDWLKQKLGLSGPKDLTSNRVSPELKAKLAKQLEDPRRAFVRNLTTSPSSRAVRYINPTNLAINIAREGARSIPAIGGTVANLTGIDKRTEIAPEGRLQTAIFGQKPIRTFRGFKDATKPKLSDMGVPGALSDIALPLAFAVGTVGNFTPTGGAAKSASKIKPRGSLKTIKKASILDDAVKATIEADPRSTYTVKPDKELFKQARRGIETQGLEPTIQKIKTNFANPKYKIQDYDIVEAEQVAGILNSKGRFADATDIIFQLMEEGTKQGRAFRSRSLLGKMTPEGLQQVAARELAKSGRKLTGEEAGRIKNMVEALQKLPDGREKNLAVQKLSEYISDLSPSPVWKQVAAVWKAGLLTGPKTTGLNISPTVGNTVLERIKDIPATLLDVMVSGVTGQRSKTLTLRGTISGLKKGAKEGADYFVTGYDPRKIGSKIAETGRVTFANNKLGRAAKAYTETVFRGIGSQDRPFFQSAFEQSLNDQASVAAINAGLKGKAAKDFIKKLVSEPTPELLQLARKDAERMVFQNETLLGKLGGAIQSVPGGEFAVPFARTPAAVATQIVNYTPVGVAKTIIENIGKGRFNQREFVEGLGRGLTGTAILAIGWNLAEKKMINTTYPTTEKERAQWELENRKASAVILDGKNQITAQSLGPAGNLLVVGAIAHEAAKDGKDESQSGFQAALSSFPGAITRSLLEQTFLQNTSQILEAAKDPVKEGPKLFQNLSGSVVPTLVADVARSTDLTGGKATIREPQNIQEAIMNRIPGLRQSVAPGVDAFGRPRTTGQGPVITMVDPYRTTPLQGGPEIEELRRLQESGFSVTPVRQSKRLSIGGEAISLTKRQISELESTTGPQIQEAISKITSDPRYDRLSDEKKAKVLEKAISEVRSAVRLVGAIDGNLVSEEAIKKAMRDLSKREKAIIKNGGISVEPYFTGGGQASAPKFKKPTVIKPKKAKGRKLKAKKSKKINKSLYSGRKLGRPRSGTVRVSTRGLRKLKLS